MPPRTRRSDRWNPGRTASVSQRLVGIEIAAGNHDALGDEVREEARPDAGGLEMAVDGAVLAGALADEAIDLLHLDDVAFETGQLRDAGDATLAVGEPLQLHDPPDRRGDLAADAGDRHRHPGHAD